MRNKKPFVFFKFTEFYKVGCNTSSELWTLHTSITVQGVFSTKKCIEGSKCEGCLKSGGLHYVTL